MYRKREKQMGILLALAFYLGMGALALWVLITIDPLDLHKEKRNRRVD